MKLSDVSKTAVTTLRSRVIESKRDHPIINDAMAQVCLHRLMSLAADEGDRDILERKLPRTLTNHIAIRARKYDSIIDDYIHQNPGSTVINLGCGFDTRYWRIDNRQCRYIELDLPEVIELKKKLFENVPDYEMIGSSIFDPSWIERVTLNDRRHFVLVAEGLFMYLPKQDMLDFLQRIAGNFTDSLLVFEAVTEKYTRGLWKKIVERKIKNNIGVDAGSSYQFGIKSGRDIEKIAPGLKVIDEWSYVEDEDVYPKILKLIKIERTQWTVSAAINP